jgi:hypothetical protein
VSITNARENLEKERTKHLMPFTKKLTTSGMIFSRINVEGGTKEDKTIFIQPCITA